MHIINKIRARFILPPEHEQAFSLANKKYNNVASSVLSGLLILLITLSMATGYVSYLNGASNINEFFLILPYHILCVMLSIASLVSLRVLSANGFAGHWLTDVVSLVQLILLMALTLLSSHTEIPAIGIKNINVIIMIMFSIGFIIRFNFKTTIILETVYVLAAIALLILERSGISNFLPSLVNLITAYVLASISSAMFYVLRIDAFCGARQLEAIASYDSLTRLHNRASFDNYISHEWSRSAIDDEHLALFLIDIDNFKAYNDNFGHVKGDKCLSTVADVITRSVRKNDFVARYGGEEFVCVFSGVKKSQAEMIAAKMFHEMSKCKLAHGSSVSPYVTFSIGCMITRPKYPEEGLNEFIDKAGEALHVAKETGRNRLVIHSAASDD